MNHRRMKIRFEKIWKLYTLPFGHLILFSDDAFCHKSPDFRKLVGDVGVN